MSMEFYQEIILLPGPEIPLSFLWTRVFTQIHIAVVGQRNLDESVQFGFAFPQYAERKGLGAKIRVFAVSKEQLEKLDLPTALRRLDDYVHVMHVRRIIPAKVKGYAVFSRYQPDGSVPTKARRFAKRHDVSVEEATQIIKQRHEDYRYPFIQLKSETTQQHFCLFIRKHAGEVEEEPNFSSYGLSPTSALPEF